MQIKIDLHVPFYDTEDELKIAKCVENLLGEPVELEPIKKDNLSFLVAENLNQNTLYKLFNHIRQNGILDTARQSIILDLTGKTVIITLHKQALFVNKIAFITEDASSPLGSIQLIIHAINPKRFLDWFAPKTEEGKEIPPRKFSELSNL